MIRHYYYIITGIIVVVIAIAGIVGIRAFNDYSIDERLMEKIQIVYMAQIQPTLDLDLNL